MGGLSRGRWGGVGIMGIQLAFAMGLRPIAIDNGEERRKLCLKHGAEAFSDEDPVKSVLDLTKGGAHAVFVTAYQAYSTAHKYLGRRTGGKVMCIALPPTGSYPIGFPPDAIILRGQSWVGSLIGSLGDLDMVLDFAKRGKLTYEPTVIKLSEMNDAVQKLRRGQISG
ncbi:uncharacterized protein A1O5_13251 [Cladophialophora psammophila CBS 110553]|uniref:Alcohol dehydrogenase-like C-terminal domain-containing protein n=1 Tax=Cladophialophora psammophila CBS 110553 TaxID=1182543 RepID=W9VKC6_9EURO|nr:uncharacterized protein A1O5_13251 [Cladophialophora psammophila CBS 110553]EXJ53475.1 hypothetical protein A1O5_13251 [Cladophialophora psammophila CBS 110553]